MIERSLHGWRERERRKTSKYVSRAVAAGRRLKPTFYIASLADLPPFDHFPRLHFSWQQAAGSEERTCPMHTEDARLAGWLAYPKESDRSTLTLDHMIQFHVIYTELSSNLN